MTNLIVSEPLIWTLELTKDAQAALLERAQLAATERGEDPAAAATAPTSVTFHIPQPTTRSRERFVREQTAVIAAKTSAEEFAATLLKRHKAPGVTDEMVDELVKDMGETEHAYVIGVVFYAKLSDPKRFREVLRTNATAMNTPSQTTSPSAEPSPSSATSTASSHKKSRT